MMPTPEEMNATQLLTVMAQHEMLLWLRDRRGWVQDAHLQEVMDLPAPDIATIRQPLIIGGFVEVCLGACRLTEHGRMHADELLAGLL